MTGFPDTSFLCALYRRQENTEEAIAHRASISEPLYVSAILLFEFRQSIRLQGFLHRNDSSKGYGRAEGNQMIADLQADLAGGLVEIAEVDWASVIATAERLSSQHTPAKGHRALDILHVATALELGAHEFLTFDLRQKILAKAASLKVRP